MRLGVCSIVVLLCVVVRPVGAADLTWVNLNGGNWGVAANWSPAQVPAAGDTVSITNDGNYTVTVNLSSTVSGLLLGAPSGRQVLSNAVQILRIDGAVDIRSNGVVQLAGGALTGTGELQLAGLMQWNGGTLGRIGQLAVAEQGRLLLGSAGSRSFTNGVVLNLGSIVLGGGTIASTLGTARITNAPSGTIEVTNSFTWSAAAGGSNVRIDNAGTFRRNGPATFTFGGGFDNYGAIELLSGAWSVTASNSLRQLAGTTLLNGGGMSLTRPGTFLGGLLTGTGLITATLTNAATVSPGIGTGLLTISGAFYQQPEGVLDLELGGTAVGTNSDKLAVTGAFELGGTLRVRNVDGYTPFPGDTYRVITYSQHTGAFDSVDAQFATPRLSIQTTNTGVSLLTFQDAWGLTLPSLPLPEMQRFSNSIAPALALPAFQKLTYSVAGAPPGLALNPTNGVLAWTPTEAQGPGDYPITLTGSDNGTPPRSVTESLTLRVTEVNTAPNFPPVATQTVFENESLQLTITATDSDLPPNSLSFSLLSGPEGLSVGGDGKTTWTPLASQIDTTNTVQVVVADDGIPSLTRTQAFSVVVLPRLLAYEPFEYPPAGSLIAGAGGGFGFRSPWTGAPRVAPSSNNFVAATPSLEFGSLAVTGQSLHSAASVSFAAIQRRMSHPLGEAGTVRYLSCLVRPDSIAPPGILTPFFGVRLLTTNSSDLFIGKPGTGATNRYILETAGGIRQQASTNAVESNVVALLVVKMEFFQGNDRFSLYVNPAPGSSEPSVPSAVKFDADVGIVTNLALNCSSGWSADEIRVGLDFATVLPAANLPPIGITPVSPVRVDEGTPIHLALGSIESPASTGPLTWSLVEGPPGASLNPVSGIVDWTPSEADGPGHFNVKVGVVNGAIPHRSGSIEFAIDVLEVNSAPVLPPIPEQTLFRSTPWSLQLGATDPDLPVNTLSYTIVSAPQGMTISPEGVLGWSPSEAQWDSVHPVTVRATDGGTPALSAERSFLVTAIGQGDAALGCPTLSVDLAGDKPRLSWPAAAAGFELQTTRVLSEPPAWQSVAEIPMIVQGQKVLLLPSGEQSRFFRLFSAASAAPVITELLVSNNQLTFGETTTINFRAEDIDCNILGARLRWTNALGSFSSVLAAQRLTITGGSLSASFPIGSDRLAIGVNDYVVEVVDEDGNVCLPWPFQVVLGGGSGVGAAPGIVESSAVSPTWQRPIYASTTIRPQFRIRYQDPEGDGIRLRITARPPSPALPFILEYPLQPKAGGWISTTNVSPFTLTRTSGLGTYACDAVVFDGAGHSSAPVTGFLQLTLAGGAIAAELTHAEPPGVEPGGVVTLLGTGFNSASLSRYLVTLAGLSCEVLSNTPSTLSVAIPINGEYGRFRLHADESDSELSDPYAAQTSLQVQAPLDRLPLGGRIRFTPILRYAPTRLVEWSVNGIPGGDSTVGSISVTGDYQAPASMPVSNPVLITATLSGMGISPSGSAILWLEPQGGGPGSGVVSASQGGLVQGAGGNGAIEVPAQAVAANTTLTLQSLAPADLPNPPAGFLILGGVELGPDGTRFLQPVKVRIPLNIGQVPHSILRAAYWIPGTQQFTDIAGGGVVAADGNSAIASVSHFSTVVILQVQGTSPAIEALGITSFRTAITPLWEGLRVPVKLTGTGFNAATEISILKDGVPNFEVMASQWHPHGTEAGLLLDLWPNPMLAAGQSQLYTLRLTRHNPDSTAETSFRVEGLDEFDPAPGSRTVLDHPAGAIYSAVSIPFNATVVLTGGAIDWQVNRWVRIEGRIIAEGAPGHDSHADLPGAAGTQGGAGGLPGQPGRDATEVRLDPHGRVDFGGGGAAGPPVSGLDRYAPVVSTLAECWGTNASGICISAVETVNGSPQTVLQVIDSADIVSQSLAMGKPGQYGMAANYLDTLSGGFGGGGGGGGGNLNGADSGLAGGSGGDGGKAVRIYAREELVVSGSVSTHGGDGGSGGYATFVLDHTVSPGPGGTATTVDTLGIGTKNRGGGGGGGSGGNLTLVSGDGFFRSPTATVDTSSGNTGDTVISLIERWLDTSGQPTGQRDTHWLRLWPGPSAAVPRDGWLTFSGPLIPISQLTDSVSDRQILPVLLDRQLCDAVDDYRTNRALVLITGHATPWTITVQGEQPQQTRNVLTWRDGSGACHANMVLFPGFNTISAYNNDDLPNLPLFARHILVLSGPDSDGDGLSDADEADIGTDPANPDTDGDSLSDLAELLYGADPLESDTDHDGASDGKEVLILHTSPWQPDTDFDGLWDNAEASVLRNPKVDDRGTPPAIYGRMIGIYQDKLPRTTAAILDLASGDVGICGLAPVGLDTLTVLDPSSLHFTSGTTLWGPGIGFGWTDLARTAQVGNVHTSLPGLPLTLATLLGLPDGTLMGQQDSGLGSFTFVILDPGSGLVTTVGGSISQRAKGIAVHPGGIYAAVLEGPAASGDIMALVSPTAGAPILSASPIVDDATGLPIANVSGFAFNDKEFKHFISVHVPGSGVSQVYEVGALTATPVKAKLVQTFPGAVSQIAFFPCPSANVSAPVASLLAPSEAPTALALGDVNGDGNLDVVVGGAANSHVTLYAGDGAGNFTPLGSRQTVGDPAITPGPLYLATADLNGDGLADVVLPNPSWNVAGAPHAGPVFLLAGPGGLGTQQFADTLGALPRVWVGDFNTDGTMDIMGSLSSGTFVAGANSGSATFAVASVVPTSTSLGARFGLAEDLDGDGINELVLLMNQWILVWKGGPAGVFSTPPVQLLFSGNLGGLDDPRVKAIDLDGDGKPDLLANGGIWFRNTSTVGTLGFVPRVTTPKLSIGSFAAGKFFQPLIHNVITFDRFAGVEIDVQQPVITTWSSRGFIFLDHDPAFYIIDLDFGAVYNPPLPLTPFVTLDPRTIRVWTGTCQ